jgi:magnesium transporter
MALFPKRYHPPGTPPGTLRSHVATPAVTATPQMSLIDYGPAGFSVDLHADVAACSAAIQRDSITWVRVQGRPTAELMHDLGDAFDLHPLALEDVLNEGQRPKLEPYDGQLFLVMHLPAFDGDSITLHQVSVFVLRDYLVTFCPGTGDPFDSIVKRLEAAGTRIRQQGVDYLLYSIIDLVIDQSFPVLEHLGARIETIEESIVSGPERSILDQVHQVKRNMILLRRSLWPQREVVNQLLRDEDDWISEPTQIYLRDCYDHTVQIMDLVESYRDMSASLLDIYMSSASMRLNEVMRVLTMIATIFIPLTFITGLYGMNFADNTASPWAMPELHWYYGYPLVWLVIVGVVAGMLFWFRHKRWL